MHLLLLVIGCAIASAQSVQELIQRGEEIYNKSCATGYCHAPKGGTGGGAPRLVARGFDEAYINTVTTRGLSGTAMPAFGNVLQRRDLSSVVAYVATLNGIANPALNFGPPARSAIVPEQPLGPEAALGRSLFYDAVRGFGRCSTCHEVSGMGIPVATPIARIPSDAAELRGLATPQVRTARIDGETMPALAVSQGKLRTVFYDLTSAPPVLRTVDSAAVKLADGSSWRHILAIHSYNDAELESILIFLRESIPH